MEKLKFNDVQEINGGSNLSYDLGKWVGGYLIKGYIRHNKKMSHIILYDSFSYINILLKI